MTIEGADTGVTFENPLIPNARLRQIYMAMMQARTLARVLQRRRTSGLEACLVSPAIDLEPGDLISDTLAGGVVDFLRGATLGEVLRPGTAAKKRGVRAVCGGAGRLPSPTHVAERIWTALGAAAALKAHAARTENIVAEATANQAGVVVLYLLPHEIQAALWRKALTFANEQQLPVLFVTLPHAQVKGVSANTGAVSRIALRCGVPGIPVDADDAVAIYRVAQESIGHARIGGGAALIECVQFAAAGAPARCADAISGLEQYILQRRVATRAWIDRETQAFQNRAAGERTASK